MSQTLYHPITSNSPSHMHFNSTIDNKITSSFTFEADPFSTSKNRTVLRKQRLPKKGTARGFKPKIHNILPELENLTHEDLEKLIGERYRDNPDNQ